MERSEIEFIYIGDTMCSWCWGFAKSVAVPGKVIDQVLEAALQDAPGQAGLADLIERLAGDRIDPRQEQHYRAGHLWQHRLALGAVDPG